jgi:hypothetical protein
MHIVQEPDSDYVLFDCGSENDENNDVSYYYNLSIKLIMNKPEGVVKNSDFDGKRFEIIKNGLKSIKVPPLGELSAHVVCDNYPRDVVDKVSKLYMPKNIINILERRTGKPPTGGKRRTKRRRSNKKRTNKRKKTKTRMKKRKTSKRKTNKRRRKR